MLASCANGWRAFASGTAVSGLQPYLLCIVQVEPNRGLYLRHRAGRCRFINRKSDHDYIGIYAPGTTAPTGSDAAFQGLSIHGSWHEIGNKPSIATIGPVVGSRALQPGS